MKRIYWLILVVLLSTNCLFGQMSVFDDIFDFDWLNPVDADSCYYWRVWRVIEEKYVGEIAISEDSLAVLWQTTKKHITTAEPESKDSIFYTHIAEMVEGSADRYSRFLNPERTKKYLEESTNMSYVGIGVSVDMPEGKKKPVIKHVFPNRPAHKAGLKRGDIIEAVDDTDIEGLSLLEIVKLIKGKAGTNVKLTISRKGWKEPKTFTIERQLITLKGATVEMKEDIAYIKISNFSKGVHKEFTKQLKKNFSVESRGIILDLRGNPGGRVSEVKAILGHWIDGTVAVFISKGGKIKTIEASGNKLLPMPMVVLIDEGSASASEICAGALKDYGKAILIGQKTFGKGCAQSLLKLHRDCLLIITTSYWLTPNSNIVNEVGITPDIPIEMSEEDHANDRDPQLEAAIKFIKESRTDLEDD